MTVTVPVVLPLAVFVTRRVTGQTLKTVSDSRVSSKSHCGRAPVFKAEPCKNIFHFLFFFPLCFLNALMCWRLELRIK